MNKNEQVKSNRPVQPPSGKRSRVIAITVFLLVILAATAVFSFKFFIGSILKPVGEGATVYVQIEEGAVLSEVADLLKQDKLIKDSLAFEILAKNKGVANQIQSGYYAFNPSESAEEILNRLVAGDVNDSAVTIPEGKNIKEIAAILEENHICDGDAFIAETQKVAEYQKKYPLLSSISLESKDGVSRTLEGYLFPDTYNFVPDTTPAEVVTAMLDRFSEVYTPADLKRTAEMGKTVDQIVIMSSLVELETKYDDDKANVASVFYNRIAAGMPLQSDITVDYARGDKTAVLTTEQTQIASPYNTYINLGLPFGPICSFGEASLQAALAPAETKYLYFVADMKTGKIYFNETYEGHQADVQTYMGD